MIPMTKISGNGGAVAMLILTALLNLSSSRPVQAQTAPAIETVNGQPAAAHEVIVNFRNAPTNELVQYLKSILDARQMGLIGKIVSGQLWRLQSDSLDIPTLLAQLEAFTDVAYVEPNYIIEGTAVPTDTSFSQQWGLRNTGQTVNGVTGWTGADIGTTSAWDVTRGSTAQVVAVLDTGIHYAHTDLASNIWSAPASFTVTINGVSVTCASATKGFNALTNTCDPNDDHGHGTHIAGIIGAVGNNSAGVAGVSQVAKIMPVKVLTSTGTGTVADAIEGIEFVIQAKQAFAATSGANVRVINASWGGGPYSQALFDAINSAYANNILFVTSAGNNATNNDVIAYYPAGYNLGNIIVAAASDSTDYLMFESNYGSSTVDLAAPGHNIYSTMKGGTYGFASGTSQAAAMVSGAAALVLSTCTTLTTDALKSTLLNNVTQVGSLTGEVATGGRLNVNTALRACMPPAKPSAPTGLTAVAGNAKATLRWTASAGATSYNIKVATSSRGPWTTVASTSATTFVVTGLTNGLTYYPVVSAVNAGGESANSTYVKVVAVAPAGPTGLAATAGQWSASLKWTAVAAATGYNVKRATATSGPWTTIGTTTGTSFTATQLPGGTVSYFVVSYLYADGESLNSAYVSATPTAPAGPTGLTAVAGNAKATLSWTASTGATGYNVKRATSTSGPWTTVGSTSSTTFTVTGLTNGTLYYLRVSFFTPDGESLNSSYVSAKPVAPAGPTGVTAAAGDASATIKWTAVASATAYNVKRSTSTSGPWTTVGTTSGTAFTVTGLANGTSYYFVVSYLYAEGESANSAYVLAKPLAPPAAPTGLKATGQTGQVYLAWSAATGAVGYNIYRATSAGGAYTMVGTTTSRAYYDKLLTKGAYFCYVLRAYNANKTEGPQSLEACATVQ